MGYFHGAKSHRELSFIAQFFMSVFWLRHALPHRLIAFLTGTLLSQVSDIISTWVAAMAQVFPTNPHPHRDIIFSTTPPRFSKHRRTVLVLDATDIYTSQLIYSIKPQHGQNTNHTTHSNFSSVSLQTASSDMLRAPTDVVCDSSRSLEMVIMD